MSHNNTTETFNPGAFTFHTPVQMRTTDIDMYQHLNNTRYLDYYDLGKAEFFRACSDSDDKWRLEKLLTVIANVNCSYIKSIQFGERVSVLTRCERIGKKSFTLHQAIVATDNPGDLRSECHTVMVCVNPETRESCDLPQKWRAAFEHGPENNITH